MHVAFPCACSGVCSDGRCATPSPRMDRTCLPPFPPPPQEGAADEVQRLRDELDFTVATYEQTGVLPEVHPSEQREKRRSTDAEQ